MSSGFARRMPRLYHIVLLTSRSHHPVEPQLALGLVPPCVMQAKKALAP
jgi:hypothetical protein